MPRFVSLREMLSSAIEGDRVVYPECEEDSLEPPIPAPVPSRSARVDTSVPPEIEPRRRVSAFEALFASLAEKDVRTKPSYTDCWVVGTPELRDPVSYMTDMGSVSIGTADTGETMYCVTPREYAYPDRLNAMVMDLIDDIREAYRERGGSLDRDSVMGLTRSLLGDRWSELQEVSGTDDIVSVAKDICAIAYRHSVGPGIFEVLLSDSHIEDVYVDAPCWRNRIHVTLNGIQGLNSHIRCTTNLMAEAREVDNLVNILKRRSGLRFCTSSPVLETDMGGFDARATVVGYPLSPLGTAVAIRKHSVKPWTLSRLIAAGSISPREAGVLSFLVNSRAAILVCGARGAGKTSFLASLCTEFPLDQRILSIEDTLELPAGENPGVAQSLAVAPETDEGRSRENTHGRNQQGMVPQKRPRNHGRLRCSMRRQLVRFRRTPAGQRIRAVLDRTAEGWSGARSFAISTGLIAYYFGPLRAIEHCGRNTAEGIRFRVLVLAERLRRARIRHRGMHRY